MQRLRSGFFNELYGAQMSQEFSTASDEEELEDLYKYDYSYISNSKIKTIKKKVPNGRSKTDGVLELAYNSRHPEFYGIQEVKKGVPHTDWQLKKQLVQALMYAWCFDSANSIYNFKFFILNSEKSFSYIFIDDIKEIRDKLWKIFPLISESPCKAFSNPIVQSVIRYADIKFKGGVITNSFSLHDEFKEIYKHCL